MDAVELTDERLRLAALERYRIIDSISEPEFDMLSRLIATICETPISLVSLVDADRQWCKSTFGIESCTTSRDFSICARSLADPDHAYVVPDAALDPSLADNPLVVGHPHVRFYAGVPLVTHDGFALGTLCVIDQRPRFLSASQYAALERAAGVVMTIIEQRMTVDALKNRRKRAELLRSVADMASDAILIFERDARATVRVVYANAAYCNLTGRTYEATVGRDIDTIGNRTDGSASTRRWIAASIEAGVPTTDELPILRADGSTGMAEVCIGPGEPADLDGRQNWLVVMRDVAALRRRDEARFAGSHDASTGLPNEVNLLRDVELRIANSSTFAVACIDVVRLDDPELGPNGASPTVAGESLAIGISRRLLATVDGTHTLARIGVTEYAIVLGDDGTSTDKMLATYLRDIAAPYRIGENEAIVTASMGVARSTAAPLAAANLLREARAKLAIAKVADRSRHPSLQRGSADGSPLDRRTLRAALDADEFRLDYQPIVELADAGDVVVGFEALLRWPQGAARGWSPLDAIVSAERSGFIADLGAWIVDAACAQLALWQRDDAHAWRASRLSINISPSQIERSTFVRELRETLARYNCDARGLTLELTETASMRDPLALRDVLIELRALEITIDLDDFGTGYSSLSRLHTFAIDRLKIDREFVSGGGDGLANDRIVETVLSLADRMSMGVIAEGVETLVQRDALWALGCHFAQGYLFARALSAADATALIGSTMVRGVRSSI